MFITVKKTMNINQQCIYFKNPHPKTNQPRKKIVKKIKQHKKPRSTNDSIGTPDEKKEENRIEQTRETMWVGSESKRARPPPPPPTVLGRGGFFFFFVCVAVTSNENSQLC